MESTKQTILHQIPVYATKNGKKLDQPYIAVLKKRRAKWLICIYQQFRHGVYGQVIEWHLDTLSHAGDSVYMDFGQDWAIHGIEGVIKAAYEIIGGAANVNG